MAGPESQEGRGPGELLSRRSELESQLKSHLERCGEFEKRLPALSGIEKQNTDLETLYTQVVAKLATEKENINTLTASLPAADMEGNEDDAKALEASAAALGITKTNIDEIAQQVSEIETKRATLNNEQELTTKRTKIKAPFKTLAGKIQQLQTTVTAADPTFNATDNEKTTLNSLQPQLDQLVNAIDTDNSPDETAYNDKFNELQQTYNKVEKDLILRKFKLIGVGKVTEQIKDEIAQLRLQNKPENRDLIARLDQIRVRLEQIAQLIMSEAQGKQRELYEQNATEVGNLLTELSTLAERFNPEAQERNEQQRVDLRARLDAAQVLGALGTKASPVGDRALQQKIDEQLLILNQISPNELTGQEAGSLSPEQEQSRERFTANLATAKEAIAKKVYRSIDENRPRNRELKQKYLNFINAENYQGVIDSEMEWLRSGEAKDADVKRFDKLVRLAVTERIVYDRTREIEDQVAKRIASLKNTRRKSLFANILAIGGGAAIGIGVRTLAVNGLFGTAVGAVGTLGAIGAARALSGVAGLAAGAVAGAIAGYVGGDIRAKRETRHAGAIIKDLEEGYYTDPATKQQRKLTPKEKATILLDMLEGRESDVFPALAKLKIFGRKPFGARRTEQLIDITEGNKEMVLTIIREHYQAVAEQELQAALAAVEAEKSSLGEYTKEENLARAMTALCQAHENGSERIRRENTTKYVTTNRPATAGNSYEGLNQANVPDSEIQDDNPAGPKTVKRNGKYDVVDSFINEREKRVREIRRGATIEGLAKGAMLGGIFGVLFPAPTLAANLNVEHVLGQPAHIASSGIDNVAHQWATQGTHQAKLAFLETHHYNLKDAYTLLNNLHNPEATQMAKAIIEHNLHIDLSGFNANVQGAIRGEDLMQLAKQVVFEAPNQEIGVRALQQLLSHPAETQGYIVTLVQQAAAAGIDGKHFSEMILNPHAHEIAKSITDYVRQGDLWDKSHASWYPHGPLEMRQFAERWLPYGSEYGIDTSSLLGSPEKFRFDHLAGFLFISWLAHRSSKDAGFTQRIKEYDAYEQIVREWNKLSGNEREARRKGMYTHVESFRPDIFEDPSSMDRTEYEQTVAPELTRWNKTIPGLHGYFVFKRDPGDPTKIKAYRLTPHKPPTGAEPNDFTDADHNTGRATDRRTGNAAPDMGLIQQGKLSVREYELGDLFEVNSSGQLVMMPPSKQEKKWRESRLLPTNLGRNKHEIVTKPYDQVFEKTADAITCMAVAPSEVAQYAFALANGIPGVTTTKPVPKIDQLVGISTHSPEDEEEPEVDLDKGTDGDTGTDDDEGDGGTGEPLPEPTPPAPPTAGGPEGRPEAGKTGPEYKLGYPAQQIRNTVKEYLYYLDTTAEGDYLEGQKNNIDKDKYGMREQSERYAAALLDLFRDKGEARVHEVAQKIRNEYERVMGKSGLKNRESMNGPSKSWIYWDLAKQYYYLYNPTETDATKYPPVDPIENAARQQEIADRHVAWEFADAISQGVLNRQKRIDNGDFDTARGNMKTLDEVARRDAIIEVMNEYGLKSALTSSHGPDILSHLLFSDTARYSSTHEQLSSYALKQLGSSLREAIDSDAGGSPDGDGGGTPPPPKNPSDDIETVKAAEVTTETDGPLTIETTTDPATGRPMATVHITDPVPTNYRFGTDFALRPDPSGDNNWFYEYTEDGQPNRSRHVTGSFDDLKIAMAKSIKKGLEQAAATEQVDAELVHGHPWGKVKEIIKTIFRNIDQYQGKDRDHVETIIDGLPHDNEAVIAAATLLDLYHEMGEAATRQLAEKVRDTYTDIANRLNFPSEDLYGTREALILLANTYEDAKKANIEHPAGQLALPETQEKIIAMMTADLIAHGIEREEAGQHKDWNDYTSWIRDTSEADRAVAIASMLASSGRDAVLTPEAIEQLAPIVAKNRKSGSDRTMLGDTENEAMAEIIQKSLEQKKASENQEKQVHFNTLADQLNQHLKNEQEKTPTRAQLGGQLGQYLENRRAAEAATSEPTLAKEPKTHTTEEVRDIVKRFLRPNEDANRIDAGDFEHEDASAEALLNLIDLHGEAEVSQAIQRAYDRYEADCKKLGLWSDFSIGGAANALAYINTEKSAASGQESLHALEVATYHYMIGRNFSRHSDDIARTHLKLDWPKYQTWVNDHSPEDLLQTIAEALAANGYAVLVEGDNRAKTLDYIEKDFKAGSSQITEEFGQYIQETLLETGPKQETEAAPANESKTHTTEEIRTVLKDYFHDEDMAGSIDAGERDSERNYAEALLKLIGTRSETEVSQMLEQTLAKYLEACAKLHIDNPSFNIKAVARMTAGVMEGQPTTGYSDDESIRGLELTTLRTMLGRQLGSLVKNTLKQGSGTEENKFVEWFTTTLEESRASMVANALTTNGYAALVSSQHHDEIIDIVGSIIIGQKGRSAELGKYIQETLLSEKPVEAAPTQETPAELTSEQRHLIATTLEGSPDFTELRDDPRTRTVLEGGLARGLNIDDVTPIARTAHTDQLSEDQIKNLLDVLEMSKSLDEAEE